MARGKEGQSLFSCVFSVPAISYRQAIRSAGCIHHDTPRIAFDTAEGSQEAVQNDRSARP